MLPLPSPFLSHGGKRDSFVDALTSALEQPELGFGLRSVKQTPLEIVFCECAESTLHWLAPIFCIEPKLVL